MNEFELIAQYFARQPVRRDDVRLGIGDDAAIVTPAGANDWVICSDLLLENVHFPGDTHAADIGHKALAVNLSDIAAMGAEPTWFTLNLSLPAVDQAWLSDFCQGLFALAAQHRVQLIGGDTARGPLSIGIQAHGQVPAGQALTRGGAQVGDDIYVSGVLGDAALGLACHRGQAQWPADQAEVLLQALHRPQPRLAVGQGLRGLATSCIDISDGLLADLGHILTASRVGATLQLAQIPVSSRYRARYPDIADLSLALSHGDDYELCFTAAAQQRQAVSAVFGRCGVALSRIGQIDAASGLRCLDATGQALSLAGRGHDHFSTTDTD